MVNKVILIGNVGADPEVRYLEGGVAVATLRLATTERYNNRNGERVEMTEWHRIVLWRQHAEFAEKYVKKGMRLYIEGRLRTRQWEEKETHVKHTTTEIYADTIEILSRPGDGSAKDSTAVSANGSTAASAKDSVVAPAEEGESKKKRGATAKGSDAPLPPVEEPIPESEDPDDLPF